MYNFLKKQFSTKVSLESVNISIIEVIHTKEKSNMPKIIHCSIMW